MSTHKRDSFIQRATSVAILAMALLVSPALAQKVVDIPTRPGVTQRMIIISPANPKAAVVLLSGGLGGLQIFPNGSIKRDGNFLVRSRQLFADQGLLVALVDAPSDRQSSPYLGEFRQKPEHAADIKAVIAWLREQSKVPIWLVGNSAGTVSVAYVATELLGHDGPDGIVLTSTVVVNYNISPAVTAMPLEKIRIPVLVVHHEQDGCACCPFTGVPSLMEKLANAPRKQVLSFNGGQTKDIPCEAWAYHGFNGLEGDVVQETAAWILAK